MRKAREQGVSIIKVAKLAGVSKSTVSLVINNNPAIPPSTALKVRQAMSALGYVPRPREQRKGPKPDWKEARRARNIALVTLGIPSAVLRAPLYNDVLHGVAADVRERGHRLTVNHVPERGELGVEEILRGGADGFLLFGRGESENAARALRGFPCVSLMGAEEPRTWCDWVSYDDPAAGRVAAQYLLEQGHRRCAFLGKENQPRARSFAETIRAAGGECIVLEDRGLFLAGEDTHAVDHAAVDALVDRLCALTPRPTGLFSWADMLTAALYPSLYRRDLRVGREITVVSCNNEWPLLLGLQPRPAVVDLQAVKVGTRAVEQLLWRMQHPREPRVVLTLTPSLAPPGL